ncbi:ATP-binding cassette domain-containing protein [Plantactinospora veratri]
MRHRDDPAGQRADVVPGRGDHPAEPARDSPGRHRSYLPALPGLPPDVGAGQRPRGGPPGRVPRPAAGARRRAELDRARGWLTRLGIEHLADVEARNMSWGQQKLLELAGVLMSGPETVLLDEPAGGVNPALLDRIGALVRELNAEGRTFVIVEHNMDLVMGISDHIVVFDRGRPIAEGPPSVIRSDERVLGAYLGV